MNVMDRNFSAQAERAEAARRAARKRRIVLAAGAVLLLAAALYLVWSFTLCGDCGGPALLAPPPA